MRLAFKAVDGVEQVALFNVSGPHPISRRPESNKKANTLASKIDHFLPGYLCWNISLFLPLDSN